MKHVFNNIYEHVIVLKFVNALENNLPQIYVSFFLAIATSDEGSVEIIETFSFTPKMVKVSNITGMIFRLDLVYD